MNGSGTARTAISTNIVPPPRSKISRRSRRSTGVMPVSVLSLIWYSPRPPLGRRDTRTHVFSVAQLPNMRTRELSRASPASPVDRRPYRAAANSLWRKSEIRTRPDRSRSVHWTAWRWARNRRLERLLDAGLVRGKTVGIDATALEANAAMRSIERRDTGESYEAFVRSLAEASGVETPTRADLARFDRSRKNKKTSNNEWKSPRGSAN